MTLKILFSSIIIKTIVRNVEPFFRVKCSYYLIIYLVVKNKKKRTIIVHVLVRFLPQKMNYYFIYELLLNRKIIINIDYFIVRYILFHIC